jgi:response regulator RpfG family c-di-GMP phosphodiesterase
VARRLESLKTGTEAGDVSERISLQGANLVRMLYGALRLTRTHHVGNAAFDRPIADLSRALTPLVESLGTVQIVAVEEVMYVNDLRIRFADRGDTGRELARELARHEVGGLTFHGDLTGPQLRAVVSCFAAAPDPERPLEAVAERIVAAGVHSVEVWGVFRYKLSNETNITFHERKPLTERATTLIEECWDNLGTNKLPNLLPVRRLVAEMVATGSEGEALSATLSGVGAYAAHTLRVTHCAMILGRSLGLGTDALQELGVAAMFHDVGYAAREGVTTDETGRVLEAGFAPPFERHGAAAARLLTRQRGFHPSKVRRMLATLEHHDDFKGPQGKPSLFARILRIAEDYDNLLRTQEGACTPAEAIARLLPHAGDRYDPVLLQAFVNAMGRFPPGTVLELEDGRVVRSCSTARDEKRWQRPFTVLVRDADGVTPEETVYVDLAVEGRIVRILPS